VCYDDSARPPLPPISGGAAIREARLHELVAADGTRFAAYSATTTIPGQPGIAILPDVRGLHPFYEELAERFAEAGVNATAIDYFGRTAGVSRRDEGFDYEPHIEQTSADDIAADTAAAVAHRRSPEGGGAEAVFTVGFCFGGRNFNQAARGHGLAGVIGFYGSLRRFDDEDTTSPIDQASRYRAPVLGLFGGADRHITADQVEAFRRALDEIGVTNEIVVYDGAPHSFFDRTADQHWDACDDAWRRVLEFIRRNHAEDRTA
jgi:carboxymethylenebutenolidase